MSAFPELYSVGQKGIANKLSPETWDGDPRGLLWVWEQPQKYHTYIMGVDPALGITGWNRYNRTTTDRETNNGAIVILRVGRNHSPDAQVAEFAAPVDPFELGYIANFMGRLFGGNADDGQCQCILETFPGPGGMTYRQMTELGFLNHWVWEYYADQSPSPSKSIGWTATTKSLRDLWTKCSRHIILHNEIIRSPWLVDEFADARLNRDKGYAESPNTVDGHGDRLRANNLALWAARGWSMDLERIREEVSTTLPVVDWQASDMSWDEIQGAWDDVLDRVDDGR